MKKRSAILTIGTCAVAALIGTAGAAHANPTYTVYVHKVGSTADAEILPESGFRLRRVHHC